MELTPEKAGLVRLPKKFCGEASVLFLFFQLFELTSLAVKLGLIGADLSLLLGLPLFLTLQLIADQRPGPET
jgi:hypothetical protein